jgi:hypothetical protein
VPKCIKFIFTSKSASSVGSTHSTIVSILASVGENCPVAFSFRSLSFMISCQLVPSYVVLTAA